MSPYQTGLSQTRLDPRPTTGPNPLHQREGAGKTPSLIESTQGASATMRIAILVDNQYTDPHWTDPRVQKNATALAESGHEVCIFATGKYGQRPAGA